MPDWLRIKEEYLNTEITTRDLAAKYEISYGTLRNRSARERWSEQKSERVSKIVAECEQKAVEKTSEALSDEAAMKVRIRQKLLRIAETWVDRYDHMMQTDPENAPETQDFRRMAQTCIDLGVADNVVSGDESETGVILMPEVKE